MSLAAAAILIVVMISAALNLVDQAGRYIVLIALLKTDSPRKHSQSQNWPAFLSSA